MYQNVTQKENFGENSTFLFTIFKYFQKNLHFKFYKCKIIFNTKFMYKTIQEKY